MKGIKFLVLGVLTLFVYCTSACPSALASTIDKKAKIEVTKVATIDQAIAYETITFEKQAPNPFKLKCDGDAKNYFANYFSHKHRWQSINYFYYSHKKVFNEQNNIEYKYINNNYRYSKDNKLLC